MISARPELVERSVDQLRACGHGRRECVVYWIARTGDIEVIDVVHPDHSASMGGYTVEGAWLARFFLELADQDHRAVARLHSHPGRWVEQSWIDDEFVLVPSPGFVSIVIPSFATDVADPSTWNVQMLSRSGEWLDAKEVIKW